METTKKWRIGGIDVGTGLETKAVVEARSRAVAALMAKKKGIEVAEIVDIEQVGIEKVRREMELARRPSAGPGYVSGASMASGEIICPSPSCGYRGPPKRRARGSTLLLLV